VTARWQHAAFAAILVGTIIARARSGDVLPKDDIDIMASAVIAAAQSQGLVSRGYASADGAELRTLTFAAPGCVRPLYVDVLETSLEQIAIVSPEQQQGYRRYYVYFGRVWQRPDRLAIFFEKNKQAMLATLGLTRYVPSWHLLLVDAPLGCAAAAGVDWRAVWERPSREPARRTTGGNAPARFGGTLVVLVSPKKRRSRRLTGG
jgi:hypothetical protein